jgi:uncharacterized protein
VIRLLEEKSGQVAALCRKYRVERLDLFGSAVAGSFQSETSDLDFIASFDGTREPDYAERFCAFADALEALFGRPVDLLTERMIRNLYFREEVEKSRQTIFERSHEHAHAQAPA